MTVNIKLSLKEKHEIALTFLNRTLLLVRQHRTTSWSKLWWAMVEDLDYLTSPFNKEHKMNKRKDSLVKQLQALEAKIAKAQLKVRKVSKKTLAQRERAAKGVPPRARDDSVKPSTKPPPPPPSKPNPLQAKKPAPAPPSDQQVDKGKKRSVSDRAPSTTSTTPTKPPKKPAAVQQSAQATQPPISMDIPRVPSYSVARELEKKGVTTIPEKQRILINKIDSAIEEYDSVQYGDLAEDDKDLLSGAINVRIRNIAIQLYQLQPNRYEFLAQNIIRKRR